MRRRAPLLLAGAIALAACAGDGPSADESGTDGPVIVTRPDVTVTSVAAPTTAGTAPDDRTTSPPTSATAGTSPPTSADAAATTAMTATTAPATTPSTEAPPEVGDPVVTSELVVEVDRPVDLAVRPGDDALYVVGQGGQVSRFDTTTGERTIVFDIVGRVSTGNEQGLLGLEFSPDAALAFVNFTDTAGTTTIAQYVVGDDGVLDEASERVVLTVDQPYGNHNAGDLAFGPDGMLYVPLGDGGSGGDPERRASDPTSLLGSLLRVAVDADEGYVIPQDNPFRLGPHQGVEGAPEVWAWGLRNPWKIAFDPESSDLWIADVGQNAHEEVNLVRPTPTEPAGYAADFGWSAFEGTERYNEDVPDPGDVVMPVLTYPHSSGGCSVSGGAPYRGTAIPELEPAYVFSDYCLGTIWALDLTGGRNLVLLEGFREVTSVRPGPDGELYVLERSGGVHRLVPG